MSIVLKNNALSNLSETLFYGMLDAEHITKIFNKLLSLQITLSYQMQLEITTDIRLSLSLDKIWNRLDLGGVQIVREGGTMPLSRSSFVSLK